jgi:hypothetical protein
MEDFVEADLRKIPGKTLPRSDLLGQRQMKLEQLRHGQDYDCRVQDHVQHKSKPRQTIYTDTVGLFFGPACPGVRDWYPQRAYFESVFFLIFAWTSSPHAILPSQAHWDHVQQ